MPPAPRPQGPAFAVHDLKQALSVLRAAAELDRPVVLVSPPAAAAIEGALWFREYHDRYIRDDDHYQNAKAYIRMNPVKAGLCKDPSDWEFSSAWKAPWDR